MTEEQLEQIEHQHVCVFSVDTPYGGTSCFIHGLVAEVRTLRAHLEGISMRLHEIPEDRLPRDARSHLLAVQQRIGSIVGPDGASASLCTVSLDARHIKAPEPR